MNVPYVGTLEMARILSVGETRLIAIIPAAPSPVGNAFTIPNGTPGGTWTLDGDEGVPTEVDWTEGWLALRIRT